MDSQNQTTTPSESDALSRSDGQPTETEIRALAYSIWDHEGRPIGHETEHWRQAESLLQAKRLVKES